MILGLGALLLPDSPNSLVFRGKVEQGRKVLEGYRGGRWWYQYVSRVQTACFPAFPQGRMCPEPCAIMQMPVLCDVRHS